MPSNLHVLGFSLSPTNSCASARPVPIDLVDVRVPLEERNSVSFYVSKMIGAALRRVAAQGTSRAGASRSMSSNIDIATEIKELKKWKVRSSTVLPSRAWNT
jgi:hypothetical protein